MDIDTSLRELAAKYETPSFIEGDPSWWMHQVSGAANQEAMAFVAQALSYGSRAQFMPRIGWLLERADGNMDSWIRSGAFKADIPAGSDKCFYRLYTVGDMCDFLEAYRRLMKTCGTLGDYVGSGTGLEAVEAVTHWFGGTAPVPQDMKSACKRVCMFLRWMVRDGSPVDLGLWASQIDKRTLIMPMDTHVLQQSVRLGLLNSRTASMTAARRLTARLAEVFPDDPLKGDFALFGEGVSGR
mgnify:FL=1